MNNRYVDMMPTVEFSGDYLPFSALYVEIEPGGYVRREVGVDAAGLPTYRFPDPGYDFRGVFEFAPIDASGSLDDISPEQFEMLWRMPLDEADQAASIRVLQGPPFIDRVRNWLAERMG